MRLNFGENKEEIVDSFFRYVNNGDKKLIMKYSLEELEVVLDRFSSDEDKEYYKALRNRVNQLRDDIRLKRNNREKWKDRFIGAFFGLTVGVLAPLINNNITHKLDNPISEERFLSINKLDSIKMAKGFDSLWDLTNKSPKTEIKSKDSIKLKREFDSLWSKHK